MPATRTDNARRAHTVALLVSDVANPWFGQIASLIEHSLRRHGYSLLLCNSGEDPAVEAQCLRMLSGQRLAGLILVPLLRSGKALRDHFPANAPVVVLDRPIPGIAASVSSDQLQAAGLLCDTLARAGARKVAIVSGPRHVVTHRQRARVAASRFDVVALHEGPAQRETGRQAFIKLLHKPVDAVICTNNFLGQGVIDGIEQIDQPPIIGCFDEIPMMYHLPIPIVCSVQDVPMLAEACVQQLLLQLRNTDARPTPIVVPVRASTNRAFQQRQEARHPPTAG